MDLTPVSTSPAMDVQTSGCPGPVRRRRFISGVVEGFYGQPWPTDQRERLFERLGRWDMNSYMYAPKDDAKHRQQWREPLSPSELDTIGCLIKSCRAEGVDFIFAISPGLDMTYSSEEELNYLKHKLDQVTVLGCSSFAVLFDDIELRMCDVDNARFASFAHAHVYVTNAIYEHLGRPSTFLFCPTEYCGSRAVPSVSESLYLHTVGQQLDLNIGVLWTGPLVIPRHISVQSVQEVGKVLRRRPVIWDNLHANDYDRQRVFLGPYQGRPLTLRRYIRGVLANPNCECEANFVAIHTLSTWCSMPVPPAEPPPPDVVAGSPTLQLSSSCVSMTSVPSEIRTSDDEFYSANRALCLALADWSAEVNRACSEQPAELATSYDLSRQQRTPCSPIGSVDSACVLDSAALQGLSTPVSSPPVLNDEQLALLVDAFHLPHEHGAVTSQLVRQLGWLWKSGGWSTLDPSTVLPAAAAQASSMSLDETLCDADLVCQLTVSQPVFPESAAVVCGKEEMSTGTSTTSFHTDPGSGSEVDMQSMPPSPFPLIHRWSDESYEQWQQQASSFHETCMSLRTMASRFLEIPNHPLLNSMFSCVMDLHTTLSRVGGFVKRLESLTLEEQARLLLYWSEPSVIINEPATLDGFASQWTCAYEPWCVRGGLVGDLVRILPDMSCLDSEPLPCSTVLVDDDSGVSDVPTTPPPGSACPLSIPLPDCLSDLIPELMVE